MVKSGRYEVKPPHILGRIGAGFGQGLAEQLPKEMERGRLSQGLKNFEKEAANLSPLEQATRLFSIPGITPQMVQVLPEILKQQNERQAAINAGKSATRGREEAPSQFAYPTSKEQVSTANEPSGQLPRGRQNLLQLAEDMAKRPKGLTTKEPIAAALSDIRSPTQEELFDKRAQILDQNPWMSVAAAQQQAEDYFARQNAQKTAAIEKGARQEALQAKVDQALDKELQLLLQKDDKGIFENISGESISALKDQAREDVANGRLTPDQSARKYGKLALQIAKNNSKLKEMSQTPLILQSPKAILNNLKEASRLWKDANRSEEFSNNLQSQFSISQKLADSIAYPIQDNKKLNTYIDKYKPARPRGLTGLPNSSDIEQLSTKAADDIASMGFSPDDSINSVIVRFKDKDPYFNETAFIDRLRKLYNDGKLPLNPRQREEIISQETTWFPNLKDWWMKISGQF